MWPLTRPATEGPTPSARWTIRRLDPRFALRRWSRRQIVLGVALTLAAIVFLELAEDVWFREGFAWDGPVALAIHAWQRPWLDTVMKAVTWTGGPGALLGAAAYGLWQAQRRRRSRAGLVTGAYVAAIWASLALKALFQRPRPALFPPLVVADGFSFPSGHTLGAVILYGLIAAFLWQDGRRRPAVLVAAWVPLIGLSRVYLGVHYPSDVLASLTAGALWVVLGLLLMRWRRARTAA